MITPNFSPGNALQFPEMWANVPSLFPRCRLSSLTIFYWWPSSMVFFCIFLHKSPVLHFGHKLKGHTSPAWTVWSAVRRPEFSHVRQLQRRHISKACNAARTVLFIVEWLQSEASSSSSAVGQLINVTDMSPGSCGWQGLGQITRKDWRLDTGFKALGLLLNMIIEQWTEWVI